MTGGSTPLCKQFKNSNGRSKNATHANVLCCIRGGSGRRPPFLSKTASLHLLCAFAAEMLVQVGCILSFFFPSSFISACLARAARLLQLIRHRCCAWLISLARKGYSLYTTNNMQHSCTLSFQPTKTTRQMILSTSRPLMVTNRATPPFGDVLAAHSNTLTRKLLSEKTEKTEKLSVFVGIDFTSH